MCVCVSLFYFTILYYYCLEGQDQVVQAEDYWFLCCCVFICCSFPEYASVGFFRIQACLGYIEGCKIFHFGVRPGKINTFERKPNRSLCWPATWRRTRRRSSAQLAQKRVRLWHHAATFMLSHTSTFHGEVMFSEARATDFRKEIWLSTCGNMC